MNIETFKKAKALRERISLLEKELYYIRNLKSRENDTPFNNLRTTAYEAIDALREIAEDDFKKL